ncbi:hypothetical protein D4R42_01280 [bacterium]|nr:MAG: hypothetical protein D4R42_01280 [bacterium]
MPVELGAKDISQLVKKGHKRVENYANAAASAIRDYVGDYYVNPKGYEGDYPINLVFVALRTWVPNLVMNSGVNKVGSPYLSQLDYAHMLGEALNQLHKRIDMKSTMRAAVVSMILCGLAVLKTSIYADGLLIPDGFDSSFSQGQLYTDLISIDDFFLDPYCTSLKNSTLTGHFTTVRRQDLLNMEGWDKDLVNKLPSAWDGGVGNNEKASHLTRKPSETLEMIEAQDYVRVAEVYLPEAQAIAYVPDPKQTSFDDFLKVQDYYGPDTGPYRFGSITPPVPDNPFPVAPVSIWRDLNSMANDLFKKLMDQADSQKDVLLYKPGMEDVADAVAEARNGDSIRTADPDGVRIQSYGGGNAENEKMTQQLQFWFNYVSGGIDQMGGMKTGGGSKTATAVKTLQTNASITQEDARGLIYDVQAGVSRDQAWFIHYDPFLKAPMTIRETGKEPRQVVLTPEEVRGDFLDLIFVMRQRSMQALDPETRRVALEKFTVQTIPAGVNAAMMMQQMGVPFNLPRYLMQAAEEMGIADLMNEVFTDPTFQARLKLVSEQAGLDPGKAGKQSGGMAGVMQNGALPSNVPVNSPSQDFNQQAQMGAAQSQSDMAIGG